MPVGPANAAVAKEASRRVKSVRMGIERLSVHGMFCSDEFHSTAPDFFAAAADSWLVNPTFL
jgi:hypothetical protein